METSMMIQRAVAEVRCGLRAGYGSSLPTPWRRIHESDGAIIHGSDGAIYASVYVNEHGRVVGKPDEGCVRRDFRITVEEI